MSVSKQFVALVQAQVVEWLESRHEMIHAILQELAVLMAPELAKEVCDLLAKKPEESPGRLNASHAYAALEESLEFFKAFYEHGQFDPKTMKDIRELIAMCESGIKEISDIPF